MGRLPVISGRRVVRALERAGYAVDRQRGSHIVLRHTLPPHRRVVVPDHREVARGTLRAILRHAGLSVEEFRDLL
ncbi:MAG: type II toxin-antitoxin system HicA family toxin [Gemmatimonadota bacterium]